MLATIIALALFSQNDVVARGQSAMAPEIVIERPNDQWVALPRLWQVDGQAKASRFMGVGPDQQSRFDLIPEAVQETRNGKSKTIFTKVDDAVMDGTGFAILRGNRIFTYNDNRKLKRKVGLPPAITWCCLDPHLRYVTGVRRHFDAPENANWIYIYDLVKRSTQRLKLRLDLGHTDLREPVSGPNGEEYVLYEEALQLPVLLKVEKRKLYCLRVRQDGLDYKYLSDICTVSGHLYAVLYDLATQQSGVVSVTDGTVLAVGGDEGRFAKGVSPDDLYSWSWTNEEWSVSRLEPSTNRQPKAEWLPYHGW